ncbi:C1 family peptidase [Kutzneria viridogrisea]|uniref:Papain cysteine protease family protein n=2 Tax=Kutzneria TaxID=43356 RepID=W5VZ50_9PSEU|nr:C1 family peptidase [Kutzneria albida]AHH93725.1 papain cysteine protease family protein [Kutzneria albida DSM 43870]MBA8931271.1 C1A family cysteine protease [Kutzneria viridogrisea]
MTSPTPRSKARYGWVPDLPDARDHVYAAPHAAVANLPASTDLRSVLPDSYDQGPIGSCTANAIGGAFQFAVRKQQLPDLMPSRLFIYYNERAIEGTVGTDSGAMIRDGVKSVAKQGVCAESEWPYEAVQADASGHFPAGSREVTKPSDSCYQHALQNRATSYQRVPRTLDQFRGCLAAGFPFVFGFTVYSSFESSEVAKTGVVPMPAAKESVLGGHAVLAVGYDDSQQRFLVRNSWGTGWGQHGHFTMPYAYLTDANLSDDFWTIRVVS